MAKKATVAQNSQRIRVVYELLLSDAPRPDVLQYAAKNWGIKTRTTDTLIKKANDLIIEEAAQMRENALEKHLTQRAFLRNKALKDGDLRLGFDILRDETKLLSLYPDEKKKVNVTWQEKLPPDVDPELVKRKLAKILAEQIRQDGENDDTPD